MENFFDAIKSEQRSLTENGATGYSYSGNPIVDLNYSVPDLRKQAVNGVPITSVNEVLDAYIRDDNSDMIGYTLKWLLYLRDIRGGLGERESFRNILLNMNVNLPEVFIDMIPEVGRWDDLIEFVLNTRYKSNREYGLKLIRHRLNLDMLNQLEGVPDVSLLAKWMPSINVKGASRKKALKLMKMLPTVFGGKERIYRKIMSKLRSHLDVVERKMSSGQWDKINYEHVPSKANLLYSMAFYKHDETRRTEYISKLEKGEAKINAETAFPHDIVHKYKESCGCLWSWYTYGNGTIDEDPVLEAMWKALPVPTDLDNFIVVRDGSGSMEGLPLDIADALSIFCSEHSKNPAFKDQVITFSKTPKYISLQGINTLAGKIAKLLKNTEVANTNVEAVFDLVLKTAVNNNIPNDEIPNILIISDMEFDAARGYAHDDLYDDPTLFEAIENKWKEHGYTLPKLVFWNVASRSGTIPMKFNKNGLILVSGYSQSILKTVMSSEKDAWLALKEVLDSKRYDIFKK